MGPGDDPSERLARYPHLFGGLLLIEPFEIGQPDGFQFIGGQFYRFEHPQRNAPRFKIGHRRAVADPSFYGRSWHGLFIAYAINDGNSYFCFFLVFSTVGPFGVENSPDDRPSAGGMFPHPCDKPRKDGTIDGVSFRRIRWTACGMSG